MYLRKYAAYLGCCIFVGASYKKTKQKNIIKNIDINLNSEPVNNPTIML